MIPSWHIVACRHRDRDRCRSSDRHRNNGDRDDGNVHRYRLDGIRHWNLCGAFQSCPNGMRYKFILILDKHIGCDMKAKIDAKKKFDFQAIHFRNEDSSHLGVVGVVVVRIIEEFGCQENGSDANSVDVKFW
jgi:hypothetical protein